MLDLEVKTKSPKKHAALTSLEKLTENALIALASVAPDKLERLAKAVSKDSKLIDTALKFV